MLVDCSFSITLQIWRNDLASTYTEVYAISHCKGCTATTPEFSAGGSRVKLANGGQYQITANADDLGYKSNNTDIAVISPGGLVTAIGEGTAVLTIYTENYDTTQILLTVTPAGTLIGDCDLDGAFSSADFAMLQNYLLGSESISDWQAADLCDDDVLDIFDHMELI